MYNALDIANFLVYLMADSYDDVTNMKLNKILYYAQGHYLKQYKKPLFRDPIMAWQHGPVIRSVYDAYKGYSDRPITKYNESAANLIDSSTKSFLLDIARQYGKYTASALRNMTHTPKSPWSVTGDGEEIPVSIIAEYFKENIRDIAPLNVHFSDDDFIGRRDSDGTLVLPEDWQDAEV